MKGRFFMKNVLTYKCTCGGTIEEQWHWEKSKLTCDKCLAPTPHNPTKVNFQRSILNAIDAGVPEQDIIKTKEDIDNYFLN